MVGQVQVSWNRTSERVTVPSFVLLVVSTYGALFIESRSLGFERKMCDKFHIKLNIGARPIANKYCEGKMKRTLERELKVPEIAGREAIETFVSLGCRWVFCVLRVLVSVIGAGVCFVCVRPVDPLGLVSISRLVVTILLKEGGPFAGRYSLGFVVHVSAEVCSRAFAGSTFEYWRSAVLSLTVSTDPS